MRLLLVLADSRFSEPLKEEFHFKQAYLLEDPKAENFIDAFKKGKVVIDLRMHLKPNGVVRNHGTGIRIEEKDMILLYNKKRILM